MKRIFCLLFSVIFVMTFAVSAGAEEPGVSAKACVLIEEKTGRVIFEKNSGEKLPMASTTKIMTTLLCLESGGLDDEFVVDSNAIKVEGSSMGLMEGDVVTKRALCYGMLLPSGNDAANAVAIKLGGTFENFASIMNERAAEIGMTRTCFVTPSGLEGEGHGASAYDMALLAREALRNPDFAEICSQRKAKVKFGNPPYERWLVNTNKLLNMYDGVKGVKTGFTDEAGRCLVSACERNGISFICVTLNDKCDWDDHMKMYDYGFSRLKSSELGFNDIINIPVVGGDTELMPAASDEKIIFGSDGMSENKITFRIYAPQFLYAPIKAGDAVGEVRYYYDENYIGSINLKAMKTDEYKEAAVKKKKGIIEKIKTVLRW